MKFIRSAVLITLLAGLAACGAGSNTIVGTWKVVDVKWSSDSLNNSPQFNKSGFLNLRFSFNADSTMEISRAGSAPSKARYSIERRGDKRYLVFRAIGAVNPEAPSEQRMEISRLTKDKLSFEQQYDQLIFTTELEAAP